MSIKPFKEKLTTKPDHSILVRKIIRKERPEFTNEGVWHFHPDYEITFTLKSNGKRFVGYNISDYSENDFVLIGSNLPHCWITHEYTEQIVINFKKDIIGINFWDIPEMKKINSMLNLSKHGIHFSKEVAKNASTLVHQLEKQKSFKRLITFFKLLDLMANSKDKKILTNFNVNEKDSLKTSNRIEYIYSYILTNYKENSANITDLSKNLNMTKSSTCKFIKKVTKKSFTDILTETKINHACKLLVETDMYISQICFSCGFNNLSHFNRSFKKIMSITPKQYRANYTLKK